MMKEILVHCNHSRNSPSLSKYHASAHMLNLTLIFCFGYIIHSVRS